MAYFNISLLPSAVSLSGSEQLLGQQSGNTVAITVAQIASLSVQAAAGSNTQVQYNSTGLLAGNAAFTFNSASGTLSITNVSSSGAISAGTVSANTASITGSIATGAFSYGSLSFNDTGNLEVLSYAQNSYGQIQMQNTSTGTAASADFVVNNSASTATTGYGDFGINSTGFTGSGSLSQPSYVYLYAAGTELAIGTSSANGIHFVVNSGATDAASISSAGVFTIANAAITAGAFNGTVGATTPSTGVFTTLSATGATVNFNGAGQAISLAPTGAGSVTINPATAGSINNMAIGATTQAAGNFTIVNVTGSTVPANGIYLSAANTTSFSSNSTIRGTINSTGTWAINATSSANASLTVAANGATSAIAAQITNSAGNAAYLEALGNGATSGTNGVKIGMDAAGSGAFISEGSTTVYLGTNGTQRLTISGAGAISVPNSSTFTVNTTGGSGLSILAASAQVANLFIAGNGDTSAQGLQIAHYASGAQIITQGSDPIIIGTNNTTRIAISATGTLSLYSGAAGWSQLAGWGTPTGAVVVSNFPGATATLIQCSEALAYVIGCLKALGALAA